jgi:hypothetical protein
LCVVQGWLQAGWVQPFVSFVVVVALFLNGAAAFIDAVCGIFGWHASLATKADVTEAKNEVKDIVNKRMDDMDKRMDDMGESLKFVITWPSLLTYVGCIAGGSFVTWKCIKQ